MKMKGSAQFCNPDQPVIWSASKTLHDMYYWCFVSIIFEWYIYL